MDMISEFLLC